MSDAVQGAILQAGDNASVRGSKIHRFLEDIINDRKKDLSQSLKKLGVDVDIAAELFFDVDGGPAQRQDKGAIGLDVLVRNKKTGKIMLGFDLKTGKAGTSRTKGKEYIRRHKGAPMIDIHVRRTK